MSTSDMHIMPGAQTFLMVADDYRFVILNLTEKSVNKSACFRSRCSRPYKATATGSGQDVTGVKCMCTGDTVAQVHESSEPKCVILRYGYMI